MSPFDVLAQFEKGAPVNFTFLSDLAQSSTLINASHSDTTGSMDINCTVRGRFISQDKEILTHHFLLCIVRTTELLVLSTSLAADPDCKESQRECHQECYV